MRVPRNTGRYKVKRCVVRVDCCTHMCVCACVPSYLRTTLLFFFCPCLIRDD